jgi:leader peptidase (prepilin peptidase)/N-methyltransferase
VGEPSLLRVPLFADPVWFGALAFAIGLCVGSFLNVVVHRMPRGESIARPRSRCPHCAAPIRAWQNVPLLSWLALRGRCARCAGRISPRYPAVELATGLMFAAIAVHFGAAPTTLAWWVLAAGLLAAALIDFDHRIIPDEISLGGLAFGLAVVPVLHSLEGAPWPSALARSAAGALLGGGTLWLVGFAHARLSVALGRRFEHWPGEGEALPRPASLDYWVWFPGMGFGDIKLLAMIGAFLGPMGVLTTIVAASLCGLMLGGAFALATRRLSQPFGFGPAIAAGAVLALFL